MIEILVGSTLQQSLMECDEEDMVPPLPLQPISRVRGQPYMAALHARGDVPIKSTARILVPELLSI